MWLIVNRLFQNLNMNQKNKAMWHFFQFRAASLNKIDPIRLESSRTDGNSNQNNPIYRYDQQTNPFEVTSSMIG